MGHFEIKKQLIYAVLGGMLPAIAWVIFWVNGEEDDTKEPTLAIILTFIIGMLAVLLAIPAEHFVQSYISDQKLTTIVWAGIEELLKFITILFIISRSNLIQRPIDYPMYFIVGALGFAGLENILFLMNPETVSNTSVWLVTGNLRFLGSTLLHAISSGIIGISMGIAFYQNWRDSFILIIIGIISAITLHSVFNLFIMNGSNQEFFRIFGFLWVVTIISILLFEKLRRLGIKIAPAK